MPNPLNVPITPPRVAFLDPRTGNVSREWYMFFLSLFSLSGGSSVSLDDLQKGPPALTIDEINALVDRAAATLDPSNESAIEQIAELRKQIEAIQVQTQPELGSLSSVNIDWVPYLGFDTAPPWIGTTAGQFWFDSATGSFNAKMGNNNITQQVGEEFFRYGKATAPISDTHLQAVYKTGTVGASGVITFAPTIAGITRPDQILGIATEPIPTNGFGRVTTSGVVRNINTTGSVYGETWADNDDIWYNPVTGGLTKVAPVAPNIKLRLGTVINAGTGSGSFFVNFGSASTLGGTDSNVQFGTLANNDLIQYDSALQYWKNVPASTLPVGTATNLAGGAAGYIPYQSAPSTTTFSSDLSYNGTTLEIGGSVSAGGQISAYSATSGAIGVFSDASTTFTAGIAVSSTVGADITFTKNRGTFASPTGVNSGDTVGRLRYVARDVTGGVGREVARIDSLVDSTPASNDISGSLIFRTRQSGVGGALTIAAQINRLQNWNIGSGAASTNISLRVTKTITGSVSSYGSYIDAVVQPDATNLGQYYSSVHATAANGGTPYTVANVVGYSATQGTFNADSTVTNQYGFISQSSLIGATNNYGFYSNIASGTGRWNFVAGNTADNAFRGNTRFGSLTAPTAIVNIAAGTAAANTAPLKFTSGTNLTTPEAGVVEYDGTIVSSTPNTNYGRAAVPLTNYASGTGTALGTNTEATNAVLLPAANDTITLAAGTYFFDTSFTITRGATSTTSATARINIRGTGTAVGNFSGMSLSAPTAGGATANFSFDAVNITTDNVLTAASTTAAGVYTISLRGVLKITTGGTIIPQYSLSANINAAGTVSKVLYLRLQQMDTQSAAAAGPAGTGWG